jgi:hypothetical protein
MLRTSHFYFSAETTLVDVYARELSGVTRQKSVQELYQSTCTAGATTLNTTNVAISMWIPTCSQISKGSQISQWE